MSHLFLIQRILHKITHFYRSVRLVGTRTLLWLGFSCICIAAHFMWKTMAFIVKRNSENGTNTISLCIMLLSVFFSLLFCFPFFFCLFSVRFENNLKRSDSARGQCHKLRPPHLDTVRNRVNAFLTQTWYSNEFLCWIVDCVCMSSHRQCFVIAFEWHMSAFAAATAIDFRIECMNIEAQIKGFIPSVSIMIKPSNQNRRNLLYAWTWNRHRLDFDYYYFCVHTLNIMHLHFRVQEISLFFSLIWVLLLLAHCMTDKKWNSYSNGMKGLLKYIHSNRDRNKVIIWKQ